MTLSHDWCAAAYDRYQGLTLDQCKGLCLIGAVGCRYVVQVFN